jgi:hypothetical protein
VLFYRAALPLSHQTLTFVSGLVRAHRREIGSLWRALNPGQQALLVLVYLRKGEPFAEVGAGFGVSTTTCWRYVNETVELLAARAPKLRAALREANSQGYAFVIIDGTLIPIDRIAADRPFYSGKHKRHGVNLQVIASPDGTILWVSGQLPGSTHDTAAARIWNIKPESQKDANRAHARLRGPGERANAQLKYWRILHKLHCSPHRAGRLAKAIHVLQNHEATVR